MYFEMSNKNKTLSITDKVEIGLSKYIITPLGGWVVLEAGFTALTNIKLL